jgi:hypothetical protein
VTYAVDRKSLEAAENPPSDWQVTAHEGLTVSWPIGAGKQDYTAWVNETKSTTEAKYVREEDKAGVSTYVYEASSAAAPITDEQTLATLPEALGASALAGLAARLPVPDAVKSQLAQALPALGDPVPLSYTYEVKSTYWVEPTTGLVVDIRREEIRKASFAGGQLSVPVYDVETHFDEASVAAAGKEAGDKRNTINTLAKTLPLVLLIVGLLLLLTGIIGFLAGRRRPDPATVAPAAPAARRAATTPPLTPPPPPVTDELTPRGTQSPTSTTPQTKPNPGDEPPAADSRDALPPKDNPLGPNTDGGHTDGG